MPHGPLQEVELEEEPLNSKDREQAASHIGPDLGRVTPPLDKSEIDIVEHSGGQSHGRGEAEEEEEVIEEIEREEGEEVDSKECSCGEVHLAQFDPPDAVIPQEERFEIDMDEINKIFDGPIGNGLEGIPDLMRDALVECYDDLNPQIQELVRESGLTPQPLPEELQRTGRNTEPQEKVAPTSPPPRVQPAQEAEVRFQEVEEEHKPTPPPPAEEGAEGGRGERGVVRGRGGRGGRPFWAQYGAGSYESRPAVEGSEGRGRGRGNGDYRGRGRGQASGYRGGENGYRGGERGFRGGERGYRGGGSGYRGGESGFRGGESAYRGGESGYRGGENGFRGGYRGRGRGADRGGSGYPSRGESFLKEEESVDKHVTSWATIVKAGVSGKAAEPDADTGTVGGTSAS